MSHRLLIVANTSWYLYNFRFGLINELLARQYEVFILAPKDEFSDKLKRNGCQYIQLEMDNKGLNPINDFIMKTRLSEIYREVNPDLILHYTVKPVLYGSMAAEKLGIQFVNNITGLGTAFIKKNWVTWLVKLLYKYSQKKAGYILFQNRDDQKFFQKENLILETVPQEVIPGTGIDTGHFEVKPYSKPNPVKFLLISRLIWDKGVGEFVEAARKIKSEFSDVCLQLLGFLDVSNRTTISRQQMQNWVEQGIIEYLGETYDVRPYIADADCVILPSYREGLPRTLLEAAAMGRPIIATDVTGCREVVDHGVNGFLCKVKSVNDLTKKMKDMINLSTDERREMGLRGREKVEKEFDEKIIIKKIINRVESVLNVA